MLGFARDLAAAGIVGSLAGREAEDRQGRAPRNVELVGLELRAPILPQAGEPPAEMTHPRDRSHLRKGPRFGGHIASRPNRAPKRIRPGSTPLLGRYLVATDFSPASENALERAGRLAADSGGEVHALHVEPAGASAAARKKALRALTGAMAVIREAARSSGDAEVRASSSIRMGDPYVEIIRCAREIGAEIILLGKAGPNARGRGALGTTAARVVRMSDTPTLIVGRRSRGPYERPLVAVEMDPSARGLIELVRRLVGPRDAPLRIIHAYRVPFDSYYLASRDKGAAPYFLAARKAAAASVAKLLESTGSRQYLVQTVLRRGDARSAIMKEATHWRADLIALGTHGRSGIAHALLGSVAEWVVANTSRDVLVARPVRFTFVPP